MGFEVVGGIIGADRVFEPDRAVEHVPHVGVVVGMVAREALQLARAQAVDAGIADVQQMRAAPAQHQRAERGGHAPKPLVLPALCVDPAIERRQHAHPGAVDTERGRLAQQAVAETAHHGLGGVAAAGAAHAIGDRGDDGARAPLAFAHGGEVVVTLAFAALTGERDADLQSFGAHSTQRLT